MIVQGKIFADEGLIVANLLDQLEFWAERRPRQVVYSFCCEDGPHQSLTYGELTRAARRVASHLQASMCKGDRALLLYPPGLDFITAFFGCIYAGVVAVPTCYPRPRRPMPRLSSIAGDAQASAILTDQKTCEQMGSVKQDGPAGNLPCYATDALDSRLETDWERPDLESDTIAVLQYTSGSTSEPKGVVLSHKNLMHNLEAIRRGFDIDLTFGDDDEVHVGVFWLPAYHDMGLIGGILTPMYVGGQSCLMSPRTFMQRPARWLTAIHENRASISGAPNFAYQLCAEKTTPAQRAGLDLSSWRLAFCGAEPIQAATLDRFAAEFADFGFRRQSFYPCYGLAECSLLAAGGDGPGVPVVKSVECTPLLRHRVVNADEGTTGNVRSLVSCGNSAWGQKIVIVDPETHTVRESGQVGEIFIKGPSNAQGYWNRTCETEATFRACLADSGDGPYLRTGDLGFVDQGELYVTGRVKDVVILRGRNHYPQDIESTVSESHPALVANAGAAFSVDVASQERLVVLHEVDRAYRNEDWATVVNRIRRTIVERHEIDAYAVILPRQASLPRTTSGKIQRRRCREMYLNDQLKVVHQWAVRTAPRVMPSTHGVPGPSGVIGGPSPVCDSPHALFGSASQPTET